VPDQTMTPQRRIAQADTAASPPASSTAPARRSKVEAYNLADLRALARKALPKGLYEFVDRGTEDEVALRRMRASLERIAFHPRVLVDVSQRSQATTFFGRPSAMPMAVAPTGAAGLLWYDGEIEIARAAARLGIPFALSTASIVSMERVAQEAGGRLWFQLYMFPERQLSYELVDRVRAAGYEALIVTADTPVSPNREYNRHNGFTLPMRISGRNAVDVMRHPRWLCGVFLRYMLRSGVPTLENYPESLKKRLTQAPTPIKSDSLNWDDLRELRRRWQGPLVVKGILRVDDARRALDCGADAIVVSNHGARNLDGSVPPMDVLPRIVDAVGERLEVMVDGGFKRGGDICKALALGAKGVFVGRAPLWGVSVDGEPGARLALEILRDEIDRVMAFTGSPSLKALDRDLLCIDPQSPLESA
jgi:isopentenyl diphosphate isomerase/L-lactate dehydrogenase-like FMN-dependent dehydrogenase